MNKRGRKNKYLTHVQPQLKEIEQWCREGAIEIEICKKLGIGESNFARYKNEFRELREIIKKGKEQADYEVHDSLFKRAIGFEFTEVTKTLVGDKKAEGQKLVITKKVTKIYPGDVTACIFWLKNRMPEKWRDSKYINQMNEYKEGITINLRRITGYEEIESEMHLTQSET